MLSVERPQAILFSVRAWGVMQFLNLTSNLLLNRNATSMSQVASQVIVWWLYGGFGMALRSSIGFYLSRLPRKSYISCAVTEQSPYNI